MPLSASATDLHLPPPADGAPSLSLRSHGRVMWLTRDRVFYAGLLGDVTLRTMGGWLLYASFGAPLRVAVAPVAAGPSAALATRAVQAVPAVQGAPGVGEGGDGGDCGEAGLSPWRSGQVALVPPYRPHRVACDERLVIGVVIEPETVDPAAWPGVLRGEPGIVAEGGDLLARLHALHAQLLRQDPGQALDSAAFDAAVFGQPLAPRRLDPRVARVLKALCDDPSLPHQAEGCAASVGLSFSRFLHLFKEQTGVSFRSLRSWKRARSLLHWVNRPTNLAHLALDIGYPDSTHFSHSIRQVYGLKPRDLFAGSRALRIVSERAATR